MDRISFGSVTGTGLWIAAAIKVMGYAWTSFANTYDKSAFQIGGGGSGGGSGDFPIIPPIQRKNKRGKRTKLPRLRPIPVIPPLPRPNPGTVPEPGPTGSPWLDPGFGLGDFVPG